MKPGWRRLPFLHAVADETGGNQKTLQSEYLPEGRFAVVDQGKELVAGYVNDESRLCRSKLPAIIFGDHTRCFKFVDFPFCIGADGVKVLRPNVEADVRYLYHYLRQVRLTEGGYARHFRFLKRSEVILPPLPEQRRIADVLDRAEALRARRHTALVQLGTFTQSLFLELFGDPSTNPRGWQLGTLGDAIFSAADGPHVSPTYADAGVPFLSTRHVRAGEITWEDLKFISHEDAQFYWRKCKPERGDILYTKGGTTGLAATVRTDRQFAVWVHVALLKPNRHVVDSNWLEAMLNSDFCHQQSQGLTHGIANRDLGLTRMVKIRMFLPPLPLQREFVGRVAAVEKLKATHRASLAGLDAFFASLQHRAFRGEL